MHASSSSTSMLTSNRSTVRLYLPSWISVALAAMRPSVQAPETVRKVTRPTFTDKSTAPHTSCIHGLAGHVDAFSTRSARRPSTVNAQSKCIPGLPPNDQLTER